MTELELTLTGQTDSHLVPIYNQKLHKEVEGPILKLQEAARAAGFEIHLASSFRPFERALTLWNEKARGDRPVLDSHYKPVDVGKLQPRELIHAILRWSALPGASRHHWGTDFDVYDFAATPEGYKLQLNQEEVGPEGMFAPMHEWLDVNMREFGFFRPYNTDRGGVAPERWHISYQPIAAEYLQKLTPQLLRDAIQSHEVGLKAAVMEELDTIYQSYVTNIDQ